MNPEKRSCSRHREEQVSLKSVARARVPRAVFLSVCNGHS